MIKETIILGLLNVSLPSLDVYSDAALMISFYVGSRVNPYCDQKYECRYSRYSCVEKYKCYYDNNVPLSNLTYTPHYGWGTLMLLPFLLNYLICWYAWATTDKRKAVTWVTALLGFYPQYMACKIIWQIWSDPKKGLQNKRHLERNITQYETCCEAVPSTLIMLYLLVKARDGDVEGGEIIFGIGNDDKSTLLFYVAFSTSVITSALGLAKNLKVGPCRILPEQKNCLGGLLSPRFIFICFACGATLVFKGLAVSIGVTHTRIREGELWSAAAIALSTFFLPGFLISLFTCWHRGILKTFLAQPSIFLLPVFTHFTFVSNSKLCCREGGAKRFISFSPISTAVNACVGFAGSLSYFITLPLFFKPSETEGERDSIFFGFHLYYMFIQPINIIGLILTLAAGCRCRCCCSCCSCSLQFGALLTAEPYTPYFLASDGQLVMERATHVEDNKEEEMEDFSSSTPNIVESETKVRLEC